VDLLVEGEVIRVVSSRMLVSAGALGWRWRIWMMRHAVGVPALAGVMTMRVSTRVMRT